MGGQPGGRCRGSGAGGGPRSGITRLIRGGSGHQAANYFVLGEVADHDCSDSCADLKLMMRKRPSSPGVLHSHVRLVDRGLPALAALASCADADWSKTLPYCITGLLRAEVPFL
jgi:hypothetical protein